MFRLRVTTDCQPRTKNGHPPQRTTGVASASSSPCSSNPPIEITRMAAATTAHVQNRRDMSRSSSFEGSTAVIVIHAHNNPHSRHHTNPSPRNARMMGQYDYFAENRDRGQGD